MEELSKNNLEGMYHTLVKNKVTKDNMWSLTKHKLDQFRVPYNLLKRYLQTIQRQGKIFISVYFMWGCINILYLELQ